MHQVIAVLEKTREDLVEFQERHALLHYSDLMLGANIQQHSQACRQLARLLLTVNGHSEEIVAGLMEIKRVK